MQYCLVEYMENLVTIMFFYLKTFAINSRSITIGLNISGGTRSALFHWRDNLRRTNE